MFLKDSLEIKKRTEIYKQEHNETLHEIKLNKMLNKIQVVLNVSRRQAA